MMKLLLCYMIGHYYGDESNFLFCLNLLVIPKGVFVLLYGRSGHLGLHILPYVSVAISVRPLKLTLKVLVATIDALGHFETG